MKKTLLLASFALGISSSYAQLSTRENDDSKEKIGARPVAGDMAITFGFSIIKKLGTEWKDWSDKYLSTDLNNNGTTANLYDVNTTDPGNLLTFRYYMADDMAIRAGLRLFKQSEKWNGTPATKVDLINGDPGIIEETHTKIKREWLIVPGIEKHFASTNIFDVYAGGDLYLGLGRYKRVDDIDQTGGVYDHLHISSPASVVGLGGVVGFNLFVANLPVSVGFEYGWNAKWSIFQRAKVNQEKSDGSVSGSLEYYIPYDQATIDAYTGGIADPKYSKYKHRYFSMDTNQNVRLLLNIYFGQ